MRIIANTDVETFTDQNGDTITLLATVRHGDVEQSQEMERRAILEELQRLGVDMTAAWNNAAGATAEQKQEAKKAVEEGGKSLEVRRFRFKAIARAMTVTTSADEKKTLNHIAEIMEAYDQLTKDDAAWVDAQVATIWRRSILTEDEKNGPGGSA